jgi:5-methylthioribose kinase
MSYQILNSEILPDYVLTIDRCREVLGEGEDLVVTEIGDGNLNYVYRVTRPGAENRSLIVKQAVPFLRMVGEEWPLSKDRMIIEIRTLQAYNRIAPDFVPDIYHADENMCVLIMQDLGEVNVLRYDMIEGVAFPNIGEDIGRFLAVTLFKTSYLGMESIDRRKLMGEFTLNDDLCKLIEEFIFTFPFIDHESNYENRPTNEHALALFRSQPEYLKRVLHFKELFLAKADALIHGDLHTGSLMAGPGETYVIDSEFAFFGPFGFDVGKIIANFLMSYTSHFHRDCGPKYQAWILEEVRNIWTTFEREFLQMWADSPASALLFEGFLDDQDLAAYKTAFMKQIFQDAIGFGACSLARRTVGIAGVADIRDIEDPNQRTRLEKMNIDLSFRLMMAHEEIGDIDALIAVIEQFYEEAMQLS